MLVRLTRKYAEVIDGVDLSRWNVGDVLDVSEREARLLIQEGWAERTVAGEPYPLVLVIEDDEPLREYYRAGMAGRFMVDECADGMSALTYFDCHRPDAVVLDLNLPRLHGSILYQELRRRPLTADIPVIVVTGVDPIPTLVGAMVLRKPCHVDVLIDALAYFIG